jgi:hypothetical protein
MSKQTKLYVVRKTTTNGYGGKRGTHEAHVDSFPCSRKLAIALMASLKSDDDKEKGIRYTLVLHAPEAVRIPKAG